MKKQWLILLLILFVSGCSAKEEFKVQKIEPSILLKKTKTALFDGDSICYGFLTSTEQAAVTYPVQIGKILRWQVVNQAVSGTCVAEEEQPGMQSMVARSLETDYQYYDWVILQGGTNDYSRDVPIGMADNYYPTTFYGAWNTIIEKVLADNPKAHIVLITPAYRNRYQGVTTDGYTYPNKQNHTLTDYCRVMKEIGRKYNIPVFDSSINSPVNAQNCMQTTTDGLHFTQESYIDYGNRIAGFILEQCQDK